MARKLKSYQTSLGFFAAIAAPSMKAALEAWGADSNLFHQGAAKESTDPDVIAATMKKPGVVLKRPVGSDGPFGELAELPKDLGLRERKKPAPKPSVRKAKKSSAPHDEAADRKIGTAGGVLYLNPGSAGRRRFGLPITLATIDVTPDNLRPKIHDLGDV
jgi:hypothetical protein